MRTRELEKIQQRFATQQHKVIEIENLIRQAHTVLKQQLAPQVEEIIDPVVSQQRFRYIQYLKQQIAHLQGTLQTETQKLEWIRIEMKEAHIKKRSMELLEEKQRKQYITLLETQETKEIEDIIIARRHHSS